MRPLIVDTDPGVDDAVALLLAAASPEVDLRAVTTVHGNAELAATTANAARVLALAERRDVPVAAGAARPLVHPVAPRTGHAHGEDGLGGRAGELPAGDAPDPRGAVALAADVLRAADSPVTIAAIGPLTNIALLLAVHPELVAQIDRIVVMGGALVVGNTTGVAEFNIHCDPEAAQRVLGQADVPVALVPLDVTLRCAIGPAWLDALATAGPRCAQLASVIGDRRVLHDAVAVLEAVRPGTVRTEPMPLQVACDRYVSCPARGALVRMPTGPTVHVAVDADPDTVLAEVLRRLTARP